MRKPAPTLLSRRRRPTRDATVRKPGFLSARARRDSSPATRRRGSRGKDSRLGRHAQTSIRGRREAGFSESIARNSIRPQKSPAAGRDRAMPQEKKRLLRNVRDPFRDGIRTWNFRGRGRNHLAFISSILRQHSKIIFTTGSKTFGARREGSLRSRNMKVPICSSAIMYMAVSPKCSLYSA